MLHASEYAMTFCEGILFVTTLEKAECSKVLEISSTGFWYFCVVFPSVFIIFKNYLLNYTIPLDYAVSSSEKKSGTGVSLVDSLGVILTFIIIELIDGEGSTFVNLGNFCCRKKII